ncbi:MAG: hypothetical protein ACO3JL_21435, partial [Myxococcota bacterium]
RLIDNLGIVETASSSQQDPVGLVALQTVGGQLVVSGDQAGQLARLRFPALQSVGASFEVVSNPALQILEVPRLTAVGTRFMVTDNPALLTIFHAAAIAQPAPSTFEVSYNSGLLCVIAETLCCAADAASTLICSPNASTCTEPSCPSR